MIRILFFFPKIVGLLFNYLSYNEYILLVANNILRIILNFELIISSTFLRFGLFKF